MSGSLLPDEMIRWSVGRRALLCTPKTDENPTGIGGLDNRKLTPNPEKPEGFNVAQVEKQAGNIDWVSADKKIVLSFKGPQSRHAMMWHPVTPGPEGWTSIIYRQGRAYVNALNDVVGVAVLGSWLVTVEHADLSGLFVRARSYPVMKSEAWVTVASQAINGAPDVPCSFSADGTKAAFFDWGRANASAQAPVIRTLTLTDNGDSPPSAVFGVDETLTVAPTDASYSGDVINERFLPTGHLKYFTQLGSALTHQSPASGTHTEEITGSAVNPQWWNYESIDDYNDTFSFNVDIGTPSDAGEMTTIQHDVTWTYHQELNRGEARLYSGGFPVGYEATQTLVVTESRTITAELPWGTETIQTYDASENWSHFNPNEAINIFEESATISRVTTGKAFWWIEHPTLPADQWTRCVIEITYSMNGTVDPAFPEPAVPNMDDGPEIVTIIGGTKTIIHRGETILSESFNDSDSELIRWSVHPPYDEFDTINDIGASASSALSMGYPARLTNPLWASTDDEKHFLRELAFPSTGELLLKEYRRYPFAFSVSEELLQASSVEYSTGDHPISAEYNAAGLLKKNRVIWGNAVGGSYTHATWQRDYSSVASSVRYLDLREEINTISSGASFHGFDLYQDDVLVFTFADRLGSGNQSIYDITKQLDTGEVVVNEDTDSAISDPVATAPCVIWYDCPRDGILLLETDSDEDTQSELTAFLNGVIVRYWADIGQPNPPGEAPSELLIPYLTGGSAGLLYLPCKPQHTIFDHPLPDVDEEMLAVSVLTTKTGERYWLISARVGTPKAFTALFDEFQSYDLSALLQTQGQTNLLLHPTGVI